MHELPWPVMAIGAVLFVIALVFELLTDLICIRLAVAELRERRRKRNTDATGKRTEPEQAKRSGGHESQPPAKGSPCNPFR